MYFKLCFSLISQCHFPSGRDQAISQACMDHDLTLWVRRDSKALARCSDLNIRFLALRYGGILATLPVVFLSATKTSGCQAAASLSQVGVVLVVTSSATIFGARTYSLWSNSRIVGGLLGGLLAVMTACWVRTFCLTALYHH